MGYHLAGFDVVGVDIDPQPNYPFIYDQGDALQVLRDFMDRGIGGFDAIHASPPCQGYTGWQNITAARGGQNTHPRLVEPLRALLMATRLPYVIENVPNAPLHTGMVLCGTSFGLGVQRHRKFESNRLLMGQPTCQHTGNEIGVYGKLDGRRLFTRKDGTELHNPSSLAEAQRAMGIDWMTWDELREAIPPAYTAWIGAQLIEQLERAA